MIFSLLAQVPIPASSPDPLGGWGLLLLQGGSFALLVYILTIMVPKELDEQREERQNRDRHFADLVQKLEEDCSGRTEVLAAQLEKQTAILVNTLEKNARDAAAMVAAALKEENSRRYPRKDDAEPS